MPWRHAGPTRAGRKWYVVKPPEQAAGDAQDWTLLRSPFALSGRDLAKSTGKWQGHDGGPTDLIDTVQHEQITPEVIAKLENAVSADSATHIGFHHESSKDNSQATASWTAPRCSIDAAQDSEPSSSYSTHPATNQSILHHEQQQSDVETFRTHSGFPTAEPHASTSGTDCHGHTGKAQTAAVQQTANVGSLPGNHQTSMKSQNKGTEAEPAPESIPASILVISAVSACLTCASCIFNTLLPVYMVTELKMSMRSMGLFEGVLEAFSYIVRMFSGVISDRMTSRKAAITLGFAMGAAAKFGMSFSASVPSLFMNKAVDRLANGVQAAPRDALIGDLAPASARSACFGLAQSLRKWGSAIGAMLAFMLMKASDNNYRLVFLLASFISLGACAAFVFLVPSHPVARDQEPAAGTCREPATNWYQRMQRRADDIATGVRSMSPDFYRMLGVIALYGLGHVNESLLEARAIEVGFGKAEATLVVATLCMVVFLCAYPLGRLADKHGLRAMFATGMTALVLGHLTLLTSAVFPHAVFVSCLFLGVHCAVFQGPLLSLVVGLSPPHLRGTAFGVYYTVMALVAVAGNTTMGTVWHMFSALHAFALCGSFTAVSLLALPWLLPEHVGAAPGCQGSLHGKSTTVVAA